MTAPRYILVVDDEADVELLISQRFRREVRSGEFAFSFARDGEQALRVLESDDRIELILLDINMPVMDGLTLLARLREIQAPVRAIIVSAYGDMPNIRTAMNRGAFDFVTKPIDMVDLEVTIRKTLDELARVQELERRRTAAERARGNLARYFSPSLVDILAERDEPFGPIRRQNLAVLFADIVGFTSLTEGMPPEDVVSLLRQFHERMTEQIFACGGTVEKYVGDAIVAVFGVPAETALDAGNALKCADGMLATLDRWNEARGLAGEPVLCMGIGVNYGPAVVGDVGSEHGMSFTVIGDTVNTASRLQSLTRVLNTPLLVGAAVIEAARQNADDQVETVLGRLRPGGEQAVRGRNRTVFVWFEPERRLYGGAAQAGGTARPDVPLAVNERYRQPAEDRPM
jgi:adenylate cyclase